MRPPVRDAPSAPEETVCASSCVAAAAELKAETQTEAVQLLQDKLHERVEYILNEKLKDDE